MVMASESTAPPSVQSVVAPIENGALNVSGTDNMIAAGTTEDGNAYLNTAMLGVQMGEDAIAAVNMNENNCLLAASGDSYPFNDQFEPEDLTAELGLFFEPNDGDEFNAFDASEFLDTNSFWSP
jgi:hypothetical protein